jgi:small subunit ribosomal protein S7
VSSPPELFAPNWLNADALAQLEKAAAGEDLYDEDPGHKFGMPELPGKNDQLQNRYPPVIEQVTKLLMRDGKLSVAERVKTSPRLRLVNDNAKTCCRTWP